MDDRPLRSPGRTALSAYPKRAQVVRKVDEAGATKATSDQRAESCPQVLQVAAPDLCHQVVPETAVRVFVVECEAGAFIDSTR